MNRRILICETRAELLKLARLPAFVLPTLTFPLAFYVFFGIVAPSSRGAHGEAARYLLATLGAFGVIGTALFNFGVSVANERGQGWLLLKRASPMPPEAYVLAKVLASLLFAAVVVALLAAAAALFGGVRMGAVRWAGLALALVGGALPFCALGLAIGSVVAPNAAPAIVNLLYLPLSFCAGLWLPIEQLPPSLHQLAVWLPTYHLGQLALSAIGFGQGTPVSHLVPLAAWAAVGVVLAVVGLRRDEGRRYG